MPSDQICRAKSAPSLDSNQERLVPETVVNLSAIATGRAIADAGFLEKHYGSAAARKM